MFSKHVCVLRRVCHVLRPGLQREAENGYFLAGTFRPRIHVLNLTGSDVEAHVGVTFARR